MTLLSGLSCLPLLQFECPVDNIKKTFTRANSEIVLKNYAHSCNIQNNPQIAHILHHWVVYFDFKHLSRLPNQIFELS